MAAGEQGGQCRAIGQADGHQWRQIETLGKAGDQIGQLFQAEFAGFLQVAALAGQVQEDHRVLGEQLLYLIGEGAKALEGAAEHQDRFARIASRVGERQVMQAPGAQLQYIRGCAKQAGVEVGAVAHGRSPALLCLVVVLRRRVGTPLRRGLWHSK